MNSRNGLDSLVGSHTMFLDSRANVSERDRLQVNCLAHAEPGCQLRMTLVEFTCPNAGVLSLAEFPDGQLGVSTLYLHADGVSLTNKEVGALGSVGGDVDPNPQLFTSNVLSKIPVRRENPPSMCQFYPPSERSCTAVIPNSTLGVFTLRLTDSRGNSLSTVTGLSEVFGVNGIGYFSCAIRIDTVRISSNDGGGLHEAPNPLPDRETCLGFLHTVDRPGEDIQRQFHS